jgi:hypothetical protein
MARNAGSPDTLPELERLSEQDKNALIVALWAAVQCLQTRVAELEAKLQEPVKDARKSSVPPSHTCKANPTIRHRRGGVARPVAVVRVVDAPCTPPPTK